MSIEDHLYPLLAAYQRMPEGVRRVVGRTYRYLPRRWRYGKAYGDFRGLADSADRWSAEDIRTYQFEQLRRVLQEAGAHCPFYRRRFAEVGFDPNRVRAAEDLVACPFLTKQDLLEHRDEMVSTRFGARHRLHVTTGGSTGVPVGFYLQRGISRPKEQAFLEVMWRRGGYRDGARLALIRGHVTSAQATGTIASYDATRDWLMLSSYHMTHRRMPEYLQALEAFRPDLLHAYPSAALQLAEYLEAQGQKWSLPLRGLLCGSERLTLPQKRLLERVFHCRVYRWYGHSERVVLAGEGCKSDYFYFWPGYGYVELGPPNDDGLCEIIGTAFHNMVMPLIRYRTGDYARPLGMNEAREREFPWVCVQDVAGREQEFLVSKTGRRISLTAFNMHDAIFEGLYALQFYQEEPGVAELRYVAGPAFHASRRAAIQAGVSHKLGDDFMVSLHEVKDTEKTSTGKNRWLVSHLSAAR